jgi:hypothetical protein
MPGEGQLGGRCEDPDLAPVGVIDEHRLAEAEVRSHLLATIGRNCGAVHEDPQRIAVAAGSIGEDAEDMQLRHRFRRR